MVVADLEPMLGIEQFVHMDNVVAGLGAVYRALSGAAPGFVGLGVIGINAHDVQFVEIIEFDLAGEIFQFAAKDEVQQLFSHGIAFLAW